MLLGPVRVGWVRVEVGGDHPVCTLVGTAHRRPVTRRIPMATATELISRGVPSVVCERRDPSAVPGRAA